MPRDWYRRSPVEVSAETFAQQVEGERVDTGRGKAEDAGHQRDDQVSHRHVQLLVVKGAVHVEHVVREPAEGEQSHEDQNDLSQTLPGLHLSTGGGGGGYR